VFEFDGRIIGAKTPMDGHLMLVAPPRPSSHLPLGYLQGGEALRQALTIQGGEFDLSHIEPARMDGACNAPQNVGTGDVPLRQETPRRELPTCAC